LSSLPLLGLDDSNRPTGDSQFISYPSLGGFKDEDQATQHDLHHKWGVKISFKYRIKKYISIPAIEGYQLTINY
jgi:hypothetical protein